MTMLDPLWDLTVKLCAAAGTHDTTAPFHGCQRCNDIFDVLGDEYSKSQTAWSRDTASMSDIFEWMRRSERAKNMLAQLHKWAIVSILVLEGDQGRTSICRLCGYGWAEGDPELHREDCPLGRGERDS